MNLHRTRCKLRLSRDTFVKGLQNLINISKFEIHTYVDGDVLQIVNTNVINYSQTVLYTELYLVLYRVVYSKLTKFCLVSLYNKKSCK